MYNIRLSVATREAVAHRTGGLTPIHSKIPLLHGLIWHNVAYKATWSGLGIPLSLVVCESKILSTSEETCRVKTNSKQSIVATLVLFINLIWSALRPASELEMT